MPDAPVVEELEPRILLSAGIEGALLADWSQDADVLMPATQAADLLLLESESAVAGVHNVRNELVFVDAATPDYATLVDQLLSSAGDDRNLTVIVIESGRDGIEQISQALIGYSNLDAVHIISHGSDGSVQLGNATLDTASLARYGSYIGGWGDALDQDADVLIYGCNLAAGEDGRALIGELAGLTGADIAASDDVTGHRSLGGDWALEYEHGDIETVAAATATVADNWRGKLDTIAIWNDGGAAEPEFAMWNGANIGAGVPVTGAP